MNKNHIKRIFSSPSNESFFIFGPRGTGKSTWLKKNFKKALWIDLIDPENLRKYSAKPERLKEIYLANKKNKYIVIDEIQKVPELLTVVHQLIENDKTRHFILTGSSSRKLKRSGVDLLAGRALLKQMHPFIACELGSKFDIDQSLKFGLVPLIFDSEEKMGKLRTYAALYLKEEVQAEGLVRNIGGFSRFLEIISFSHAGILNITNIARECEVERKAVYNYLEILKDLLLSFELPVFTKKAKRVMSVRPKFYLFDTGIFRSLRPKGPFDQPNEINGAALEGLIAQHLKAWIEYNNNTDSLYFWRTRSGSEIDFIIYGENGLFAIEVKNSDKIRNKDLTALKSVQNDYPGVKTFLLYRGKEKLLIENTLCLPCTYFLQNLQPGINLLAIE